ncbi:glutamyl-tRNA reductase [Lacimicrobium alkaliphilum]|uniref:Glutamyl-tRNA reductase n=1 Tax=Lacimicrobium alkaliphilum TaxID=1526571 RepID=A0A0U3AVL2_9ALTE|nr:glutamyl-tRNA reductase [Lacimicrobium alkaliphilum]ALS98127.1 glutamyl-tRNA reductase [Lacimicrobium alkaliphilum]
MALIAFGINHNTAPVEVREKVAFSADSQLAALLALKEQLGSQESVILSTCNRTEIYADVNVSEQQLGQWLAAFHQLDNSAIENASYCFTQDQAIRHLMRVASGLDSMVLGEPQILGQVKQAYTSARHSGMVGSGFDRLFQQTFSVAKKVRSDTDIGANAVSVAFAAVQLAKHIFSSLNKVNVLLIGAGETIELVARHLHEQKVQSIRVANRTLSRASEMAQPLGADVITLAQIPDHLHEADVVISSTASQLPILGKGVVERALKKRRHQPMFLVDLAVPRDVESEVAELDDAYLYTVDDLQQIVQENRASRQSAAEKAEALIEQGVAEFLIWHDTLASVDLVRSYREQSEAHKQKLQQRALKQLQEGKDAEAVIAELANKLTNSLIHAPTKAIKHAAANKDQSTLELLRQALGLDTTR